jgi:predicted metal-dependent phosphoesterase TrpH
MSREMIVSAHSGARSIRGEDAVDLQMHTIYSDGNWQPVELFDYLAAHEFRAVAVTDHDTLEHTDELVALGAEREITVLRACEVSTTWRGGRSDLLCFAGELTSDTLAHFVRDIEQRQYKNTLAVHEELTRRGYTFPRMAEQLAYQGGRLRIPADNVRLLVSHGHAETPAIALEMIRDAGYISIMAPLADAVAAAHASGAVALIAHPGRGSDGLQLHSTEVLAEILGEIPIDGAEVLYPLHTPQQVEEFSAFISARGLLRSAGSDSHGPRGRLPIPYPASTCAALLARCGVTVDKWDEGQPWRL